jgi:hypothetical protein
MPPSNQARGGNACGTIVAARVSREQVLQSVISIIIISSRLALFFELDVNGDHSVLSRDLGCQRSKAGRAGFWHRLEVQLPIVGKELSSVTGVAEQTKASRKPWKQAHLYAR